MDLTIFKYALLSLRTVADHKSESSLLVCFKIEDILPLTHTVHTPFTRVFVFPLQVRRIDLLTSKYKQVETWPNPRLNNQPKCLQFLNNPIQMTTFCQFFLQRPEMDCTGLLKLPQSCTLVFVGARWGGPVLK